MGLLGLITRAGLCRVPLRTISRFSSVAAPQSRPRVMVDLSSLHSLWALLFLLLLVCMASTPLPISNSLATAASLRHPSPLLLNPKSRPYPHLLRPRSSKGVAFTRVPTRKPSSFGVPYRFSSRRGLGFVPFFGNNGGGESSEGEVVDEADAARGQSTLPERFRYLTKEVPDRPVRWPWIIGAQV